MRGGVAAVEGIVECSAEGFSCALMLMLVLCPESGLLKMVDTYMNPSGSCLEIRHGALLVEVMVFPVRHQAVRIIWIEARL